MAGPGDRQHDGAVSVPLGEAAGTAGARTPNATSPTGGGVTCWVCRSTNVRPWRQRSAPSTLQADDLRITDHRYGCTLALVRCGGCGFIFAEGDELRRLTALYEDFVDVEYETSQDSRRLQFEWLLDEVTRSTPAARTLLDVGAGAGLLVAEARRRGLDATGVEPNRALVTAARRAYDVALLQGTFPHPALAGRQFDVVTLMDVIEHVANPVEVLSACAHAITPQGAVAIVTPDVNSVAARVFGRRWWHYRIAHVGYFTRASLTEAMRAAGLRPAHWFRAKWFFRVRYVSERLEEYLPVAGMNRVAQRSRWLQPVLDRIIALNLHDSWVTIGTR